MERKKEGKEKRKEKPSTEGKLGVEGIKAEIILEAFRKAGISADESTNEPDITSIVFYETGLSGGANSSLLRKKLQKRLGLPELMSSSALMEVLNTMMNASELAETVSQIKEEADGI